MTRSSEFTYPLDDGKWRGIYRPENHQTVWVRPCPQIDRKDVLEIFISQETPDSALDHDEATKHMDLTLDFRPLPEVGIEIKLATGYVDHITFRIMA